MYRSDTQSLEHSTWVNIPQNQSIGNLAYMGGFNFESPLGDSKKPFTIIPYINAIQSKNFDKDLLSKDFDYGLDLKIPVGNSLNIDATINPDFSQVEVDDQIVNITNGRLGCLRKDSFLLKTLIYFQILEQENLKHFFPEE